MLYRNALQVASPALLLRPSKNNIAMGEGLYPSMLNLVETYSVN